MRSIGGLLGSVGVMNLLRRGLLVCAGMITFSRRQDSFPKLLELKHPGKERSFKLMVKQGGKRSGVREVREMVGQDSPKGKDKRPGP